MDTPTATASRVWDLNRIKKLLTWETVLDNLGINFRAVGGGEVRFACIYHDDQNPSCQASNNDDGFFHCFGCHKKGKRFDFVMDRLQLGVRETTELIATQWLTLDFAEYSTAYTKKGRGKRQKKTTAESTREPDRPQKNTEKPFTPFGRELDDLDPTHPYLASRGITPETARAFGIGYCKRGLQRGRIAIPIRRLDGTILGYCGRLPKDDLDAGDAKYKFPAQFPKSDVLYHLDRHKKRRHIVLVEGVFDVLRLHEMQVPAIASFGSVLLEGHLTPLSASGVKAVTILFDGDEAGEFGSEKATLHLSSHFFVRQIHLPIGMDPASAPDDVLRSLLNLRKNS